MTSQSNIQKAKSVLRKYRVISVLCVIGIFLPVILSIFFKVHLLLLAAVLVASYLLSNLILATLFFGILGRPLTHSLDAPLYHEIIKQGKAGHASGVNQAGAEYYVGNYANAIAICRQKLAEPRYARIYRFHYYHLLANCYFDLGEDRKLKEICDLFYQNLALERKREKILKKFAPMKFYSVYANGNLEACEQYLNQTQKDNLSRVSAEFQKARIAWLRGETEQAKASFEEVIRTAPLLHYAVISEKALQAMKNGGGYADAVTPIVTEPDKAFFWALPKGGTLHTVTKILVAVIVFFVLFLTFVSGIAEGFQNLDVPYYEEVETLVGQDYEGVQVLHVFELDKNGKWIDTLFLAETKDSVLICSYYSYVGDEKLYYRVLEEIPLSAFAAEDFSPITQKYKAITSEFWIHSGFYKRRSEIPDKDEYTVKITVNGESFYFAVTEIKEEDRLL